MLKKYYIHRHKIQTILHLQNDIMQETLAVINIPLHVRCFIASAYPAIWHFTPVCVFTVREIDLLGVSICSQSKETRKPFENLRKSHFHQWIRRVPEGKWNMKEQNTKEQILVGLQQKKKKKESLNKTLRVRYKRILWRIILSTFSDIIEYIPASWNVSLSGHILLSTSCLPKAPANTFKGVLSLLLLADIRSWTAVAVIAG